MDVKGLGSYIRDQREKGALSLRKLSGLAGVSIPYLSQVERGLRKPSAEILQAIAKGLRVSAETLYVQAGILEDRSVPDVASAIMSDPTVTERQKQALIQIYEAFREETGRAAASASKSKSKSKGPSAPTPSRASKPRTGATTTKTGRSRKGSAAGTTPKEV
ncbi:MAG TPA: helix-turn-helix transcriptional regulator [Actinomycetota bacterium]|nr:helix-turn-helix transcriptional regulator [Actinomycetota bacterium]